MPLLLLIRHGENEFVKTGKMAGRLPGVHLNERGRQQAADLAEALKDVPLKAVYSSSLERAVETAEPIAAGRKLEIQLRPDLMDTDIGKWQGRTLKSLSKLKKWKIVQQAPSRFTFPEGGVFPREPDPHRIHPGRDRGQPQTEGHCGGRLSRRPDQTGGSPLFRHAARSLPAPGV